MSRKFSFTPLRLDQRGRLYPCTVYFHYQSSELAGKSRTLYYSFRDRIRFLVVILKVTYGIFKSLWSELFWKRFYLPNKKSFARVLRSRQKRVDWVNENWDNILNYDCNILVSKADDKFLFLAFCMESYAGEIWKLFK